MTAPNAELAYKVLDHIDADPRAWRQSEWIGESDCGTVACFAGWAVLLSGATIHSAGEVVVDGPEELIGLDVPEAADRLLNISPKIFPLDAADPYDGLLARDALGEAIARIFGPRPAATS